MPKFTAEKLDRMLNQVEIELHQLEAKIDELKRDFIAARELKQLQQISDQLNIYQHTRETLERIYNC